MVSVGMGISIHDRKSFMAANTFHGREVDTRLNEVDYRRVEQGVYPADAAGQ